MAMPAGSSRQRSSLVDLRGRFDCGTGPACVRAPGSQFDSGASVFTGCHVSDALLCRATEAAVDSSGAEGASQPRLSRSEGR